MKGIFSGIRQQPGRLWLFLDAMIFVLLGSVLAVLWKQQPTLGSLAFGFAHAFPSEYNYQTLMEAFAYQFFPLFMMYLSGFSLLTFPVSLICIGIRAVFSGYIAVLFYKVKEEISLFPFFFAVLCAMELLTLLLYLSAGCSSLYFSEAYFLKRRKSALCRYTKDFLFLLGLVFFFYLIRGGAVLLACQ